MQRNRGANSEAEDCRRYEQDNYTEADKHILTNDPTGVTAEPNGEG